MLAVNAGVLEKTVPEPLKFIVPAPVNVIRQAVVPQVTAFVILRVPVEMVMISSRALDVGVVALMVSEPQDTIADPIARVAFMLVDGLGMVIAPMTDSVWPLLIVTVVLELTAA